MYCFITSEADALKKKSLKWDNKKFVLQSQNRRPLRYGIEVLDLCFTLAFAQSTSLKNICLLKLLTHNLRFMCLSTNIIIGVQTF